MRKSSEKLTTISNIRLSITKLKDALYNLTGKNFYSQPIPAADNAKEVEVFTRIGEIISNADKLEHLCGKYSNKPINLFLLEDAFLTYFEADKINISDTGSTYDIIMLNCPFSDFSPHISVIADSVFDLDRYTHVAINKQDLYIIFQ